MFVGAVQTDREPFHRFTSNYSRPDSPLSKIVPHYGTILDKGESGDRSARRIRLGALDAIGGNGSSVNAARHGVPGEEKDTFALIYGDFSQLRGKIDRFSIVFLEKQKKDTMVQANNGARVRGTTRSATSFVPLDPWCFLPMSRKRIRVSKA